MKKVNLGIIGCGFISSIYIETCKQLPIINIIACADLDVDRAKEKAEEFDIPKGCSVDELLSDPNIDLVLNLTIPLAHAVVTISALESGKHVYSEKPFAVSLEDGQRILTLSKKKGLIVGAAPDTFLGGGIQSCRKLIDEGWIGQPIAATAFMMNHGTEHWHPNPEFYYQAGGGPMFDMGPYYLTALINLIGPIHRVTGCTRVTFPERTILSNQRRGTKIKVEVPTHIAGVLEFENGAIGTMITSFDVWGHHLPYIEIYGTTGSLKVPDPDTFGGPIYLRKQGENNWTEVPLTHGFSENSRGIGLADMANSLLTNHQHRANGDLAFHVLEIMHGFHLSSTNQAHYQLKSTCVRPEPLPSGMSFESFNGEIINY
jgi:predicted dehydrogenase